MSSQLMHKLCKPNRKGERPIPTESELQELIRYCRQDVLVEMELARWLPPFTEQPVYALDQVINERGVPVDMPLVRASLRMWEDYSAKLNTRMQTLTDLDGTQNMRLVDWLNEHSNLELTNLTKATVRECLARDDLSPSVREVLELRQELGSAAVKKFYKFYTTCAEDQRIRNTLRYHGASTGRWAGQLIQPQNLPRGCVPESEIPLVIKLVHANDTDSLLNLYPEGVGDVLGSLTRSAIYSPAGLLAADFAGIEARVSAWLAGCTGLLEGFRNGEDVYVGMAQKIFKQKHI